MCRFRLKLLDKDLTQNCWRKLIRIDSRHMFFLDEKRKSRMPKNLKHTQNAGNSELSKIAKYFRREV